MFEVVAFLIGLFIVFVIGLVALLLLKKLTGNGFNILPKSVEKSEGDSDKEAVQINTISKSFQSKVPLILKGFGVVILGIISLSSLGFLSDITNERSDLYNHVVDDIGNTWGNSQRISGPVLVIPFSYQVIDVETFEDKDGNEKTKQKTRTVYDKHVTLPLKLKFDANLEYNFRYRGIYQAMLYNANISGVADFPIINLDDKINGEIYYLNSYLSFGVSDNKAIQKVNKFSVNQLQSNLKSGTQLNLSGLSSGFHSPVEFSVKDKSLTVDFNIDLRGSKSISILPLAENTFVNVESNWKHPSFSGMLPINRNIDENGFSANWELSHLVRNYPQEFRVSSNVSLDEVEAKTVLFEPVTNYKKIKRSVKYGIMFIGLTFMVLLCFDVRRKMSLSMTQYFLVGVSLSLFYLLLLSLSEHFGFFYAYLIASGIAVISISFYVGVALKNLNNGLLMGGLLSSLYAVLYSILKLEQFALLTGSGFLVFIMLILMYFTRNMAKVK